MSKTVTFYLLTVLSMGIFTGCAEQATAPAVTNDTDAYASTATTATTESVATTTKTPAYDQLTAPKSGDKIASIETDKGTIKFKLFTDKVPEMTKNFEELANAGKYEGTPFHRVMKNFMIQTGDFNKKNGTGGYSYKGEGTTLDDEIVPELKHLYGTVSMANRGPDTNGSQFFIVTNKNGTPNLNGGYTVFGQVYEGMDVAEEIQNLQVPGTEAPSEEVLMKKVEVSTFE